MSGAATPVVSWRAAAPGVRVVTLDRGPANALHPDVLDGLHAAVDAAGSDGDVRVMVLASAVDGFFAAGADIKHLRTLDPAGFLAYGAAMRRVNDRLAAAPWLSVAAVDGLALGGGLELALACTLRIAGPRASFGLPEVRLGLIPGAGGTQRLPRQIGRGRALDLMLTARQMPADEALTCGLVERATDGDVLTAALALAEELGRASLPAQRAVVGCVDVAADRSLSDGCAFEADQIAALFETGEAAEGIAAFVEKRRPTFR